MTRRTATRRIHSRRYRTTGELLRAVRDQHLVTQAHLAARAGISGAQLSRYETGRVEPGHEVLRRLLGAVGLAPTYGVEPSTAALDEQFEGDEPFWYRVGFSSWLLVQRLVWPLVDAGVPLVAGGELATVCHGVPVPDPELVVHVRRRDVPALEPLVAAAHADLVRADGRPVDPDVGVAAEDELAVRAGIDTVRVLVSDTLPASTLVAVPRLAHDGSRLLQVPAATVEGLLASGSLGPAALALTTRSAQRRSPATSAADGSSTSAGTTAAGSTR